jgi:2-polyprenyl-3-methyl-5-hydroxy-6-metoxy-1,4-benzoquinol methylase
VIYGDYLKGNIFSVYSVGEQIIRTFKPTGRLLDIGAGKGDFLSLASKQGYHSKGIEPSPRFCQHAREKYGAHIAQGFLGDEGCFNGERFDIVTMFHVLEHVKTPQKLLATVSTHLEKNGIIYIEVPNADATLLKIADALFRISGKKWSTRLSPLHEPFHAVGYSPKSLTYLLKKNGFDIVYIDTFSGNVRGYETSGKFAFFTALARNIVSKLVNLLGNRDLISVVVKKNPYNSF